ncbi:VWA domain-containing protein [Fulvivirga sp. 29W222]|uniref:VWA domain-containing protein n=1 Tax=Fulvivirga marina TaxID=2494733 RepID=A0A937G3A6_9BACT|nr:VWA domain-containing protein [Fulvivirga marina]MBL6449653.1 VWA domain-containing protein [Fulvivirga marina]
MMKVFYFLLSILLSLIWVQLQAQSISHRTAEALDAYTQVTNKSIENLTQGISCLKGFQHAVTLYKERQHEYNFRSYKSACIDFVDDFLLQKQKEKATQLTATERAILNHPYNAMLKVYGTIVEKCRELETYVNLQDYANDVDMAWAENKLQEIQKEYENFRTAKRKLDAAIDNTYRKYQPYNPGNIHHVAEQRMRDIMKLEADMMDLWAYNLRPKIPINGIPNAAVIRNLNLIDSTFRWTAIPKVSLFYKKFVYHAFYGAQGNKRYWLDRNIYKNQLTDEHANSGYKAFLNDLNNGALPFFNRFCTYNDNFRGIALTGYCPSFVLPEEPVKIELEPVRYDTLTLNPITPSPERSGISQETAYALNSYIEFVNHAVRVCNSIPHVMINYNHSVNNAFHAQRNPFQFHYTYPDIPLSYYKSALFNSKYIPKTYRTTLNKQVTQIWQIFDELQQSLKQLELMTYEKSNTQHIYEFIYSRLRRVSHLIDQFNHQTDALYNNIKSIYESYPKDMSAPWMTTGTDMTALMDESRAIITAMYSYIRDSSGVLPTTDRLNEKAREAFLNKHANLDGINASKYGTYPSKIEKYYNEIIDGAKEIGELARTGFGANPYSDGKRGTSPSYTYKEFVYKYNHLIQLYFDHLVEIPDAERPKSEFFNPHIDFEPVSLLKHQKKMTFYTFIPPAGMDNQGEQPEVEQVDELYVSMEGYALNHLVLLLDVSSSMRNQNKLPLLKKSLKRLLSIMREEDKMSIVIYSENARAVLKGVSCQNKKVIKELDKLSSEGTTNIKNGVELAYKIADKFHIEGGNNRIILATDGQFNIPESLYELISEKAENDIIMSVFYYGNKNVMPKKMAKMAEAGNGKFSHVTTENTDLILVKEAKAKRLEQ